MKLMFWIVLLLMLATAAPAAAQTPTPIPILPPSQSLPDNPQDQIADIQATAAANLETLDASQVAVPEADGQMIWGYAKYFLSTNAAADYAGPFAPIFVRLGVLFSLTMAGSMTYALAWIGAYMLSWASWIALWFYRAADFVLQLIQAAFSSLVILAVIAVIVIIVAVAAAASLGDFGNLVNLGQ